MAIPIFVELTDRPSNNMFTLNVAHVVGFFVEHLDIEDGKGHKKPVEGTSVVLSQEGLRVSVIESYGEVHEKIIDAILSAQYAGDNL